MNTCDIELPSNPIAPMLAAQIDEVIGKGTADIVWQLMQEFAGQAIEVALAAQAGEISDLKHDIGEYVRIASEQAAEIERLRGALEAMLEIHGVTQSYADKHIEIPQSWVKVSDIARAALASGQAAPSDKNGGHRLVEPDHETALALADAPRSLRNYVAALRSALTAAQSAPAGEREAFELWGESIGFCVTGKYAETIDVLCAESAFKAGYKAALQSQDAEDAERYRLLRRGQKWSVIDGVGNELRAEGLDAAIDHARRVEGEL